MLNLSHKKLEVYQTALKLVNEVYVLTKGFPREEQFVLVSQLRRAVVSVCSNIAEGAARRSKVEKKRFFEIARSSVVEIDTQFEIALNLNYSNKDKIKEIERYMESVFRMLSTMINNLETQTTSH